MLKNAWSGAIMAAMMMSGAAFGATYHVDAQSGDDARSGLSPAEAWRSLERANRQA